MFDDLTTLRSFSSPRQLSGNPVSAEWEPIPLFVTTRDGDFCSYRLGGGNSPMEVDGKTYVTRVYCDGKLALLDTEGGVFSRSGDGIVAMGTRDVENMFPVEIETVYFLGTA